MDFQTVYQLYDYCERMYNYYDVTWITSDSESYHLMCQFLWLKDYLENTLNQF